MTKKAVLALGFGLAALAQVTAIGVAGGGHGWNAPIRFSLLLWFTYPALAILGKKGDTVGKRPAGALAAVLVGTAICADLLLVVTGDNDYLIPTFAAVPIGILLWLTLWVGWQAWLAFIVLGGAFGCTQTAPPRY
jgi:hypothetical protein